MDKPQGHFSRRSSYDQSKCHPEISSPSDAGAAAASNFNLIQRDFGGPSLTSPDDSTALTDASVSLSFDHMTLDSLPPQIFSPSYFSPGTWQQAYLPEPLPSVEDFSIHDSSTSFLRENYVSFFDVAPSSEDVLFYDQPFPSDFHSPASQVPPHLPHSPYNTDMDPGTTPTPRVSYTEASHPHDDFSWNDVDPALLTNVGGPSYETLPTSMDLDTPAIPIPYTNIRAPSHETPPSSPDVSLAEARRRAISGERFLQGPSRLGANGEQLPGKIHAVNWNGRSQRQFTTDKKLSARLVGSALTTGETTNGEYRRPDGIPPYTKFTRLAASRKGNEALERNKSVMVPPSRPDSPDVPLAEAKQRALNGERFLQGPPRLGANGEQLPGKIHAINRPIQGHDGNWYRRSDAQFSRDMGDIAPATISHALTTEGSMAGKYHRPDGISPYPKFSSQDAPGKASRVGRKMIHSTLPPPPRPDSLSVPPPRPDSPDIPLVEAQRRAISGERFLQGPPRLGANGEQLPGKIHAVNWNGRSDSRFADDKKLSNRGLSRVLTGNTTTTEAKDKSGVYHLPPGFLKQEARTQDEMAVLRNKAKKDKQEKKEITGTIRAISPNGTDYEIPLVTTADERGYTISSEWLNTYGAYETKKDQSSMPMMQVERTEIENLKNNPDSRRNLIRRGIGGRWKRTDQDGKALYDDYKKEQRKKSEERRKDKRKKKVKEGEGGDNV